MPLDWRLAWKSSGRVVYDPRNWDECTANSAWASCGDNAAIRYDIAGQPYNYYSRVKPNDGYRPYEMMNDCWRSEYSGKPNKVGADFQMFSTEQDLLAKTNAWTHCSNDDCDGGHLVGYPRDCGPTEAVAFKWHLIKGSIFCKKQEGFGQGDVEFYITVCGGWSPPLCGGLGWDVMAILLSAAVLYVLGGVLLNKKLYGTPGGLAGAVPHRAFWMHVYGLAVDGVAFVRAGGRRKRGGAAVSQAYAVDDRATPLLLPGSSGGSARAAKSEKKKSGGSSSKAKKSKQKASSRQISSDGSSSKKKSSDGDGGGSASLSEQGPPGWSGHAAALAEQRDQAVHSSQQKIKVVTSGGSAQA